MAATENNSIQQIAEEATTLPQFYERYLSLACSSLNGIGAVAWHCSDKQFAPIAQVKGIEDQPIRMNVSEDRHTKLLLQAMSSADPMVVRPDENGEDDSDFPTILIARIRRGATIDLIELFIHGGLAEETNISRLRELTMLNREAENTPSMRGASSSAHLPPNAGPPASSAAHQNLTAAPARLNLSASQLDQFSHVLHQSLDPKETARKISNEIRRVLDCDRVTVMKVNGKRVKAIAVSGQPTVNRKSNTVSLLEKATRKIIAIKQTFWFPSDDQLPPQISKHLNEYLAISATRSMIVYPIFDSVEKDLTHPDQRDPRRRVEKKLIGGIVIEHCKEQWSRDAVSGAIEMVSRHSADAYRNSWQHHNLFAYPLWYWLGKSRVLTTARNLPKTLAAVAGLTLLTLALIFVPADFRMTCEGTLLPEARRNVFANTSGVVKEVLVDHGEPVEKDQPLVRLENIDLSQQIQTAKGKSEELTAMIRSARTALSDRRNQDQSRDENITALEAQLKSVGRELKLLREKEKRLTVVSPIQGSVVTYDVRDILKDRPVERVEALMEVADLSGSWQLELNLPDRKIGHVIQAFEKNDGEPLEVEFILAAKPGETLKGKLIEIGKSTEMLPEKGQHLKLKVAIEDQTLDIKQLRSGVNAYIDCGECSLGYSWFHPVLEFLQTKVLFPFF